MKQTNDKPQPAVDGGFLRSIQAYRNGETLTDLSEALRKVTEAVTSCGKTGSVTLKMIVRPAGNAVQLQSEVTMKAPRPITPAGIFFVDETFNLVRDDPNQAEMNLRTVPAAPADDAELRKAVAS